MLLSKYPSLRCDIHASYYVNADMNILNNGLFVLVRGMWVVPDGAAGKAMISERRKLPIRKVVATQLIVSCTVNGWLAMSGKVNSTPKVLSYKRVWIVQYHP